MKHVLLANLGLRNLYYKNAKGDYLTIVQYIKESNITDLILLNETFATEEYDFRQFTKSVWEELETGRLDRTLIDPRTLTLKDLTERNYEALYLFYTDQSGTKFQYQDTIHEASILKQLFQETLPDVEIQAVLVNGNPADEYNLYKQYTPLLKKILATHPESQIVFHDVGGTTQMKLVAKTLLEYYLRQQKRKLTIRYKDHWSEEARESDRTLHSRYLFLDVAREFIEHFQFKAAADVLERLADIDSDIQRLTYHIRLADDRLNFRFKPRPTDYAASSGGAMPVFEDWVKRLTPVSFLPDLSVHERVNLFEFVTICDFYFQQKNYTLGVATYYRLCEELCQAFVRDEGTYDLTTKDNRDYFAKQVYYQVQPLLTGSTVPQYGLPVLLAYASKNAQPHRLKAIFDTLLPTISHVNGSAKTGMNYLRNQCWLAHNNQAITEKAIKNEVPDFIDGKKLLSQLFRRMSLPTENALVSMQKALLEELSVL